MIRMMIDLGMGFSMVQMREYSLGIKVLGEKGTFGLFFGRDKWIYP